MAPKRLAHTRSIRATATRLGVAVVVVFSLWASRPAPASAGSLDERALASELLIAQGDLKRLSELDLPFLHKAGLQERLKGALGLLPWLLRKEGDADGADELRAWQNTALDTVEKRLALRTLLITLAERHPLNVTYFDLHPVRPSIQREARSIHVNYCSGCHDDMENGDPDVRLPARDLFLMAEREAPEIFLARLINGVKGDETIGFVNPLNDTQIAALWRLYSAPQLDARRDE